MDIRVEPAGQDTRRVLVYGELDMASRAQFLGEVTRALGGLSRGGTALGGTALDETTPGDPATSGSAAMTDVAVIEVDLTEASFLDAAGVGALMDARNAVTAAGRRLRVRGAAGLLLQVLEICGVVDLLGAKSDDEPAVGQ